MLNEKVFHGKKIASKYAIETCNDLTRKMTGNRNEPKI